MLPDPGLRRGRVVGCTGPAAISLALALASRSVIVGSWLAVVGVPMLGVEATAEFGIPLSRLVVVEAPGGPATWSERVAAAADGFDIIVTRPPSGAERVLRKVRTRLQARGVVMIVIGTSAPSVSCDLEFSTTSVMWCGLRQGSGHLVARPATVRAGGRRMQRPVERELWLPGHDGCVALVDADRTKWCRYSVGDVDGVGSPGWLTCRSMLRRSAVGHGVVSRMVDGRCRCPHDRPAAVFRSNRVIARTPAAAAAGCRPGPADVRHKVRAPSC